MLIGSNPTMVNLSTERTRTADKNNNKTKAYQELQDSVSKEDLKASMQEPSSVQDKIKLLNSQASEKEGILNKYDSKHNILTDVVMDEFKNIDNSNAVNDGTKTRESRADVVRDQYSRTNTHIVQVSDAKTPVSNDHHTIMMVNKEMTYHPLDKTPLPVQSPDMISGDLTSDAVHLTDKGIGMSNNNPNRQTSGGRGSGPILSSENDINASQKLEGILEMHQQPSVVIKEMPTKKVTEES